MNLITNQNNNVAIGQNAGNLYNNDSGFDAFIGFMGIVVISAGIMFGPSLVWYSVNGEWKMPQF